MYLLVTVTMHRFYDRPNVERQYVPVVTGPRAVKNAFIQFMGVQNLQEDKKLNAYQRFEQVAAGFYVGLHNGTAMIVGAQSRSNEWVGRDVVPTKLASYRDMGTTHFSDVERQKLEESCFQRLYRQEELPKLDNFEPVLW